MRSAASISLSPHLSVYLSIYIYLYLSIQKRVSMSYLYNMYIYI